MERGPGGFPRRVSLPAGSMPLNNQRMKVLEVVLPGAGIGWACGVPLGLGNPGGGATVLGASGGGWLVTGAGAIAPGGNTVVAGGEHGVLMVGDGMIPDMEGIMVIPPCEHGSGRQLPTGVEQAGVPQAGVAYAGVAYIGGGPSP